MKIGTLAKLNENGKKCINKLDIYSLGITMKHFFKDLVFDKLQIQII
jgi:hypothetical protein